jgi:hypothetical protein
VRGTPITVRCDCGVSQPVRYGDRWTCPECGKTWNTQQIPAEEYWGTMRTMRRYQLTVWGITALVLAIVVPLSVLVAFQVFVFAILILGGLYFYVLPRWRGRVLNQMRDRPSWNLHPE